MTFKGKTEKQVDDAIAAWHNCYELSYIFPDIFCYLGWTEEEYKIYVEKGFSALCKK